LQQAKSQIKTSHWLASHVAQIGSVDGVYGDQTIPLVTTSEIAPILAGIDLWDLWPLQSADGSTVRFDGWALWFVLSSPTLPDPESRHGVARIRLMSERMGQWRDHGNALPLAQNPGSREWAGSSLFDPESGLVTLFYTAAGHVGEAKTTYAQRLFQTTGRLILANNALYITDWSTPHESLIADGHDYVVVNQTEGIPGFIKGFRDPAHVRDAKDGQTYLLFTGSLAQGASEWNGCIGIGRAVDATLSQWALLPPLLGADGLNNEQERPHIIQRDGLYYLFWSTQRKVFAADAPSGPNGLYGMVASEIFGPYAPLNDTGLVAANPDTAPYQTYSWWVTDDLEVAGFVDYPQVASGAAVDDIAWRRAHFGGVPAPRFRLKLDGARAWVDSSDVEG
jgi:levansucrase